MTTTDSDCFDELRPGNPEMREYVAGLAAEYNALCLPPKWKHGPLKDLFNAGHQVQAVVQTFAQHVVDNAGDPRNFERPSVRALAKAIGTSSSSAATWVEAAINAGHLTRDDDGRFSLAFNE